MTIPVLLAIAWTSFVSPPESARPWTYWFWENTQVDRETIVADVEALHRLGFGTALLMDPRGYGLSHFALPPPTVVWGGDAWMDLVAFTARELHRRGLRLALNVAASGGKLNGAIDVGADAPKVLVCRRYLPGDAFETPSEGYFHDVAAFAVRGDGPAARTGWENAGDGFYSMYASAGVRDDGGREFERSPAREVRELGAGENGAGLGAGWTVVRFGWKTVAGREREVDILDRAAVRRHLDRVLQPLRARIPDLCGRDRTLTHVYNVSWEGAMPTWSGTFEADFARIAGYALRQRLPVLAGFDLAGVDSAAFMRDYRRVRSEMIRLNFYGTLRDYAHGIGLDCVSESGGPWRRNPQVFGEADQLAFLGMNDIPQGEFWPAFGQFLSDGSGHANANGRLHVRGAVSAAHVYGRPIASAEAFTHMNRHWSADPAFLKPVGDQAFADGINLMVWHTYTSSPKSFGVPGLEYFAGSHINRNVTWHRELKPFITYLSRCQCLLQTGRPVTDIAVLAGSRPYSDWGRYRDTVSDELDVRIPPGFAYDLVNDGALAADPSLTNRYPVVYDARRPGATGRAVPTGALLPDVEGPVTWCHRRDGADDFYFVAGEGRSKTVFREGAKGRSVEIWDAVRGTRAVAAARTLADGRTEVELDLPFGGSAFVVFAKADGLSGLGAAVGRAAVGAAGCRAAVGAAGCRAAVGAAFLPPHERKLSLVWDVSFRYPDGISAPPPKPRRWTALADFTAVEDLRYFAGTAAYRATFAAEASELTGAVALDIGEVPSGLARVRLNGRDLGVVWCAPWRVEVGGLLRPTDNHLEIDCINNWNNRMVGDCFAPEGGRVTRSIVRCQRAKRIVPNPDEPWIQKPSWAGSFCGDDPLQPSGLRGPVRLIWRADAQRGASYSQL